MVFTSIKKLGQLARKKLMEDGLFGSLKPFGSQIKFFKLKKVQNEAIALPFTVALKSPIRIKLSFFRQLISKTDFSSFRWFEILLLWRFYVQQEKPFSFFQ